MSSIYENSHLNSHGVRKCLYSPEKNRVGWFDGLNSWWLVWRNLYTCSQLLIKVDFARMRCRQSRVYRAGTGMAKNKVRIYKSVVLL